MRSHCLLLAAFGTLLKGLPIDGKPTSSSARNANVARLDEAEPTPVIALPHAPLGHGRTASVAGSPSRSKDTVVNVTSRVTKVDPEERGKEEMLEEAAGTMTKLVEGETFVRNALDVNEQAQEWALKISSFDKSGGAPEVERFADFVRRNADQAHRPDLHIDDTQIVAILRESTTPPKAVSLFVKLYEVEGMKDHAVQLHRKLSHQNLMNYVSMEGSWEKLELKPEKVFELLGLGSKDLLFHQDLVFEWFRYVKRCQQTDKNSAALTQDQAYTLFFKDGEKLTPENKETMKKFIETFSSFGVDKKGRAQEKAYGEVLRRENALKNAGPAKEGGAELSDA